MKGWLVGGAVALIALLAFAHLTKRYIQREALWRAERDELVEARKQADNVAKAAERGIEVERRRQQQLQQRITVLERRTQPTVRIVDTLAVPDTCKKVVAPLIEQLAIRDSIIEVKDSNLVSYDRVNVYVGQQLVAARVSLAELEHRLKQPKRSVFVPRFGVGGACGAGLRGPDCVAGVTLSWSF